MNISFFFSFAYGGNEIPSQLGAQDQNNEEILFIEYDRCESIFKSSLNHDSTLIIYSFFSSRYEKCTEPGIYNQPSRQNNECSVNNGEKDIEDCTFVKGESCKDY